MTGRYPVQLQMQWGDSGIQGKSTMPVCHLKDSCSLNNFMGCARFGAHGVERIVGTAFRPRPQCP